MFSKPFYHVFWVFLLLALILPAQQAHADGVILYAAPTASGSNDCSSWANACTLQTALTRAVSGDQIWVKAGVHYPGTNRTDTFVLKNGVAVYGGFAGTETTLSQRNPSANVTILSGDIDGNDTNSDGNYIAETTSDIQGANAYHVVTGGGTDSSAVLDGFIITAGQANSSSDPDDRGGGMYNDQSSPTLRNLTFSGNYAEVGGGGMYNTNSSPMLTDVTFNDNYAGSEGGGMANWFSSNPTLTRVTFSGNSAEYGGGMANWENSNPTLIDVTFSENTAYEGGGMANWLSSNPTLTRVTFSGNSAEFGGGMFNYQSSPTLKDVTFSDNTADQGGGGMYNFENSSSTLTDVIFSNNSATFYGGGVANDFSSSPTLTNVIFSGNFAGLYGGGMANIDESSPRLINVLFSGNRVTNSQIESGGGGMYNLNMSSPTLINVTFSGNSAIDQGGGMCNLYASNPTLINVILWGDSALNGQEIYNDRSSNPSISYSDIQGCGGSGSWDVACGTDGGGNIDNDPRFEDADGPDNNLGTLDDDLHLDPTSPAIDAGNNGAVPAGITTDLDGNPRFVDIPYISDTGNGTPPIVDMGAYEAASGDPTAVRLKSLTAVATPVDVLPMLGAALLTLAFLVTYSKMRSFFPGPSRTRRL